MEHIFYLFVGLIVASSVLYASLCLFWFWFKRKLRKHLEELSNSEEEDNDEKFPELETIEDESEDEYDCEDEDDEQKSNKSIDNLSDKNNLNPDEQLLKELAIKIKLLEQWATEEEARPLEFNSIEGPFKIQAEKARYEFSQRVKAWRPNANPEYIFAQITRTWE